MAMIIPITVNTTIPVSIQVQEGGIVHYPPYDGEPGHGQGGRRR